VALSYGGVGKFCGESVSGHERGKVGFDVSLGKSVALSYRSGAKFCGESVSVHERGKFGFDVSYVMLGYFFDYT
jgi:hypothetical protein